MTAWIVLGILARVVPAGADGLPSGPVRVVALKMDRRHAPADHRVWLRDKPAGVTAGLGTTKADLVVVPEYTFYIGYENDPARIEVDGVGYYRVKERFD